MIGYTEEQIFNFAESYHYNVEKLYDSDQSIYLLMKLKSHSAAFYFQGNNCDMIAIFPATEEDLFFYVYHFNHSEEFNKISEEIWTCLIGTRIISIQYTISDDLKYFLCKEI